MFADLRAHIAALDAAGELRRISARVSPVLEISAIVDQVRRSPAPGSPSQDARRTDPRFFGMGGPALLFENVEGSAMPVLINAFGSYRRVEMALGTPDGLGALAARIADLVKPAPPRSLGELVEALRRFAPLRHMPPRRRSGRGPCQEVILRGDDIDLTTLPMLRCWPHDGDAVALGYPAGVNDGVPGLGVGDAWEATSRGRYITLGGVHTIHADDAHDERPASHNIGMYRAQLLGRRRLAMHWHMHHDGARHWRSWKARGEPMPIAIALGGESVLPYAATAPLPPGISELLLAGYLNGRGIEMVRGVTVPLWVPAQAEIIIEGLVSPGAGGVGYDPRRDGPIGPDAVFEGPFGDHTGFYSLPDRYPVLEVTAITTRHRPIYPTTVVGLPPQEDYFLGKATERVFLPLLRTILPDIEDYDLPLFGAFHNAAFVRVRKSYPLHARRVMHGVWGAGQMSWTKSVVVVDDDVDVHDAFAVLKAVGERCLPGRDCELVRGPLDILDHAAPFLGAGAKVGFDATRKSDPAETHRALDPLAQELCDTTSAGPVTGDAARATLARVAAIPGVLGAAIPEPLGGWWLFVQITKDAPGQGAAAIKALGAIAGECALPCWTIVVGPDADLADPDMVLFHWMAHACPERDRFLSKCGRRIAFDATPKLPGDGRQGLPVRDWPPILRVDDATASKVRTRWADYGLGPRPA